MIKARRVEMGFGYGSLSEPGDFARDQKSIWWFRCPNASAGIFKIDQSDIEEHKDGSITVKTLIKVLPKDGHPRSGWSGRLTKGEWHEC